MKMIRLALFALPLWLTPLVAGERIPGPAVPYIAMIAVATTIIFFGLWRHCKGQLNEKRELLGEKEEKIAWLRKVMAQNEHAKTKLEHETEKRIMELTHTIETLERKAKEGTKNQVVAKIEAQQQKREKALSRAGLSE